MQLTFPSQEEMYNALVERDSKYEGIFVAAIRTTGIFCRPVCPARKPKPENVEYFHSARDALGSGYRPCKRCHPMEPAGASPDWLRPLLTSIETSPDTKWSDAALREQGLEPSRVRRWFKQQHGMTLHAYLRARRLGSAFEAIREGDDLLDAAMDSGYDSSSGFYEAFSRWFDVSPGRARGSDVEPLRLHRILTPLGPMVAGATDSALCLLEFFDRRMLETQFQRIDRAMAVKPVPGTNAVLQDTQRSLELYFSGKLKEFDLPVHTPGTEFQERVWNGLKRIPYGETRSYGELATEVGKPGAQRAIGKANGDNRVAIVIPCHRVIRGDGTLSGYGGGLWRKTALLELETKIL